jgi:hypothetical protein
MEAASTSVENHQNNILTAVPETLKKLTLYLTRIFYGLEHYVIMYYVQENVILKEEQIRDLCKMEQRLFRQIVALLKVFD